MFLLLLHDHLRSLKLFPIFLLFLHVFPLCLQLGFLIKSSLPHAKETYVLDELAKRVTYLRCFDMIIIFLKAINN